MIFKVIPHSAIVNFAKVDISYSSNVTVTAAKGMTSMTLPEYISDSLALISVGFPIIIAYTTSLYSCHSTTVEALVFRFVTLRVNLCCFD